MRKIGLEELKQTELEILDVVTKFCDENNIKYWISYGTLIGAIRHKGFIPWDDDIDLCMLRPDYDKFVKLFNENNERYKACSVDTPPPLRIYTPFTKVIDTETVLYERDIKTGINIDIFVYDNIPDDDKECEKIFRRKILYVLLDSKRVVGVFAAPAGGSKLRRFFVYVAKILLRIFPKYYFSEKVAHMSRPYLNENTKRVAGFAGLSKTSFDRNMFNELIDVEFEGRKYKAPALYDEYLRIIYGDYMQLPPIEERKSGHCLIAYKK